MPEYVSRSTLLATTPRSGLATMLLESVTMLVSMPMTMLVSLPVPVFVPALGSMLASVPESALVSMLVSMRMATPAAGVQDRRGTLPPVHRCPASELGS